MARLRLIPVLLICGALASAAPGDLVGAPQEPQAAPTLEAPKQSPEAYEPEEGQDGKDVVWVPTSEAVVERMLDLANVGPADYVIDLGSGDGRTVIAAARRGARARGVEFNPEMVALSKRRAAAAGVSPERASFVQGDLFETDLSRATVITMFLLPSINMKLRPHLLELAPGTRVVSNSFSMEDWEPDDRSTVGREDGCENWCTALLWIVPAKVSGTWRVGSEELRLEQQFQMLTGTLGSQPIDDGRVRGKEIRFKVAERQYTGRVNGRTIDGAPTRTGEHGWTATRVETGRTASP